MLSIFLIVGLCGAILMFIGDMVLIGLKWTMFPRWMFIVTPGILFLLLPLTRKLPKGLHMIISGGWTNLISVIYLEWRWQLCVLHNKRLEMDMYKEEKVC